jgi:sarcosine oxidase subunit beta
MKISQERWPQWAAALGDRRIFDRVGHLQLFESEADLPAAETQARRQEAYGVRTRVLGRGELHRLEPYLSARVIGALYCPDDGVSDHTATTRALARAARRAGAHIREGVEVVGLELEAGRAIAVRTSRGERIGIGRELVLAANAGSAQLIAAASDLHLPLFNVLPQLLLTGAVHPVPVRHLIGHVHRRLAMKALAGGRLMITGGWLGRVNPETGRGETIDSEVAGNLAEAVAVYPSLAGVRVTRALADRFESVVPDLLPVIDRLPGAANVVVAAGWSGQGWAPAPAYVTLIADWLLEGQRPELLEPFTLARLGSV